MNILFNALVCGLGNCGGARTVLLCQQELIKLGHVCNVATMVDNFTWFEHKQVINYIPSDTDVIINVSAQDYVVTRNSNVPKKYAWWRAHEDWSNTEDFLIKCYLDKEVKNIVNSVGLQKRLASYGAESVVVYQGVDIDKWEDINLRPENKIRIGCLYTKQPRKRWKDFVRIEESLGTEKYEYVSVGNEIPGDTFLTKSVSNVGYEELEMVYSSCHMWFAPTDSEGLHNVPIEANLCGCLVVCSDHELNGMVLDYAFDDTAMIYEFGDLKQASELISSPDWSLVGNMQEHIINNIGTREDNMKKMVDVLGDV